MRSVKGKALLTALCAMMAVGTLARADVTVEEGASVVVYPKVIANGTRDTVIQLTNISNDVVFARCFYVNAQLTNPGIPEHPILNPPLWLETDFDIRLTRQQPTHWIASDGRAVDPFDACLVGEEPTCVPLDHKSSAGSGSAAAIVDGIALDGLGIDPGQVPPLPPDFVGELKCIEVDASGAPIGGNHLKGEATLLTIVPEMVPGSGDPSTYNAIGIKGTDLAGATGNDLLLNNSPESEGQYDACPAEWILNHFAEGAVDPAFQSFGIAGRCAMSLGTLCATNADCPGGPCQTGGFCSDNSDPCVNNGDCNGGATCLLAGNFTEVTFVPCSQDFENQRPATVTIQFKVWNEFEEVFSTSTSVTCWKNIALEDIGNSNVFDVAVLRSEVAQTFMTPADGTDGGFLVVAETARRSAEDVPAGHGAVNVHSRGDRFLGDGTEFDHIIIPDQH